MVKKYNITKRAYRRYRSYNPKYFPLKYLQIIFENIFPFFNLWLSAEIVTALYEGRGRWEIYILVAVTLSGNLFLTAMDAILKRTTETQLEILENKEAAAFYHKTLSLDYDRIENPETRQHRRMIREKAYINGYGVQRMRDRIQSLVECSVNLIFAVALFAEMFSLVATAAFRWTLVLLAAVMIAGILLTIFSHLGNMKRSTQMNKELGEAMLNDNRMSEGYCYPNGMDNRIYCQQNIISGLAKKQVEQHRQAFEKASRENMVFSLPEIFSEGLLELGIFFIVCYCCVIGAFPVGSVIKYVGYLGKFTHGITDFFGALGELKENESFLATYLDYFDIPNDMYQGSLAVEKRSDKKYEITFQNVSFRYPGAGEDALKNIDLNVRVGERLAVVGKNGSGKTTFIKLLCRLYDPSCGEVILNDFNVRKYDYRQYLDLFSVVFQDFSLLAVPLGNNVASASAWDARKAEKILEEVGFGERYARMPGGLETPLYKDFDKEGVNVSGGEAQKLALARALYKDAPFIILDEPTAALDPIAEAEIYSKFDEIVGDKTAIYISHRLSSCRFCDRIAVFDKGRIVQVGTHEELLADESGKYYELWHAQAQYYRNRPADLVIE